jgi:hypothetical protein
LRKPLRFSCVLVHAIQGKNQDICEWRCGLHVGGRDDMKALVSQVLRKQFPRHRVGVDQMNSRGEQGRCLFGAGLWQIGLPGMSRAHQQTGVYLMHGGYPAVISRSGP